MPVWDAEVTIDEELVRGLLAEQFPELDATSARPLAEGWDNSVWVVEEQWAFRLPRRAVAVALLERELAVLARLAPLLPVAVPVPVHVGRPSDRYRWPFFGARLLPGSEPADASLSERDREQIGSALGDFLRVLHAPELRATVDPGRELASDPSRRADGPFRAGMARDQLRNVEELGLWQAPDAVAGILEEASRLPPPSGPSVLAHGDLHLRHVLVKGGALSGVIDWGDVCVADAAIDLVLVWSLLPPAGRERFLAAYGPVDEEARLRARALALSLCAALALYAHDTEHSSLRREALAGLERTLVDGFS